MIRIEEICPPRKLSGISSFLVSFPFNPELVKYMGSLEAAYYHKKDYTWEIPAYELSKVLDTLTFYDAIDLKLYNEKSNQDGFVYISEQDVEASHNWSDFDFRSAGIEPVSKDPEQNGFKIQPFAHQFTAINYGILKKRYLLLDSMGVGKTNEIIWTAETLKRRGKIDHCLIICGINSVKQNWKKEIQKFSTESCRVLGEKISKKGKVSYAKMAERAEELRNPIDAFFVITNIETIRDEKVVDAILKSSNNFGMIAVDEIHKVATKTSKQGANLLKLQAEYMVGATGTLITNNPLSCYVPLAWTGNDRSILTKYKEQYCVFGGFNAAEVIGYKNLATLREEIVNCMIRRTLPEIKPVSSRETPKIINTEYIELDDAHMKFYEAIKAGVKEEADKINLNSSNLLALTTRLRQAAICPGILTTQAISSTKLERCAEMVEELVSQGEKVVVLGNFKEPVYQLAEILKEYNPLVCTGDIKDDLVSHNVDLFQNDPNSKVLIGTHSKMGTGITLNSAMYMIMLDTPFTYSSFAQSCDRIWRVNNTRPAYITVLVGLDTIDERVEQIVNTKKDLSDYLVDGDVAAANSLTKELASIIREL